MKLVNGMTAMVCLACFAATAHAQQKTERPLGYPVKPVRILVGSSPGGGVDTITRGVALKLSERWGQSFLVENRTGGGGTIAVTLLAQAAPDGYTLYGGGSQVVTATPLKKVPFDTRVVLAPVAQMTSSWYFLLAHPSLPVKSVKDLVALAKRRPGTLNYGSAGAGSASHLGGELFKFRTGTDMQHIPYKGNGQALIDLISGQIETMFTSTISGSPHVKSGKARTVAVTALKRLGAYPDVPTVSESGVPDFELENMYGIYAPAGVPTTILNALSLEIGRIINAPEMERRIAADGAEAAPPASPAAFKQRFADEIAMWEKFIRTSGVQIELR
ncbi:MAG: tripartite tricarboxylate transporter substrate binding protein [Betaproteobacteria bacterium]|nr:tripartite tricarboxylate transporter substrate binding protein [Betaproteobacteria bacterium]